MRRRQRRGAGEHAAGGCQLEHGELLAPETARRLACDAGVVRIIERDGRPLTIGRKTRTLPPSLRRALRSRDRGCRFPGCCQRRFLHAHHVQHWAHGGPTELSNLVQLCRYHHRLVHEGGYTLERTSSGGLRFTRPDGHTIPPLPQRPRGNPDRLRRDNRDLGIAPDHDTPTGQGSGDRLDLALQIDGLVYADPRFTDD